MWSAVKSWSLNIVFQDSTINEHSIDSLSLTTSNLSILSLKYWHKKKIFANYTLSTSTVISAIKSVRKTHHIKNIYISKLTRYVPQTKYLVSEFEKQGAPNDWFYNAFGLRRHLFDHLHINTSVSHSILYCSPKCNISKHGIRWLPYFILHAIPFSFNEVFPLITHRLLVPSSFSFTTEAIKFTCDTQNGHDVAPSTD